MFPGKKSSMYRWCKNIFLQPFVSITSRSTRTEEKKNNQAIKWHVSISVGVGPLIMDISGCKVMILYSEYKDFFFRFRLLRWKASCSFFRCDFCLEAMFGKPVTAQTGQLPPARQYLHFICPRLVLPGGAWVSCARLETTSIFQIAVDTYSKADWTNAGTYK